MIAADDQAFALDHITKTFELAERSFPDLMEPHSSRLADAESADVRLGVMRCGLRETFRRRYPMPDEFWLLNRSPVPA